MITTNLASGYHRDLQIIKESFLPVFEDINCLRISTYMLDNAIVNDSVIYDDKYKYIFSVDVVNKLVLEGMSFRDAYKKVGIDINNGDFEPVYENEHTHEGSIGNLNNDKIRQMMDENVASFNFSKSRRAINKLLGM